MKIVIDVEPSSDMDNKLTVFLLQHKMKFTRLPDLQQANVMQAQSAEQEPPTKAEPGLCFSCKQPMDEDSGRWGICTECLKESYC